MLLSTQNLTIHQHGEHQGQKLSTEEEIYTVGHKITTRKSKINNSSNYFEFDIVGTEHFCSGVNHLNTTVHWFGNVSI